MAERFDYRMLVPAAFITAAVASWDVFAPRAGYPTASFVVWDTAKHPVVGPLFVGVWAALTWHLFFTDGRTKARHLRSTPVLHLVGTDISA